MIRTNERSEHLVQDTELRRMKVGVVTIITRKECYHPGGYQRFFFILVTVVGISAHAMDEQRIIAQFPQRIDAFEVRTSFVRIGETTSHSTCP